MSAPNNVNVNLSHSVWDFLARYKLRVFDGSPRSLSTRRQTNRKSEPRCNKNMP